MEHEHLQKDWRVKTTYAISRFAIRHYVKGARKFRRWTAKLLMPRPRGPVVVETHYGFKTDTARLMKIDVEGWELEVMQGARKLLSRPDAPIVVFETSKHVSASETKVLSTYQYILSLNQYLPFKLKSGKEVISRLIPVKNEADLPDHDNLFCFLPAHLKTLPREIFAR